MAFYYDHTHQRLDDPAAHLDRPATILMVYVALVIGAIATIAVSFADLGGAAIWIHMLISTAQVCVVGYFWMHLQRSDALTWLVALSGIFIMLILFALPLSDYLTRHLGAL